MTETRWGLLIDRRAGMTLNAYPPEDQARIRSSLGHLLGPGALEKLGKRVHLLPGDEPLYSLRVPPDIRVIFARRGDSIIIIDILRRGTLEAFASRSAPVDLAGDPEQPDALHPENDLRRKKPRAKLHREAQHGQR